MKIGGQYTGILIREGTKLEMSGVKVRFLKLIAVLNGAGGPEYREHRFPLGRGWRGWCQGKSRRFMEAPGLLHHGQ